MNKVNHGFVHMSEIQEQAIPTPPPLDYQKLLLSLADEYFAAAYELGAIAETVENSSKLQEYYRLIATGLSCLDALLKKCKLGPEKEANVRLQYASILYEETENAMEAEEALSKGISICERHKYFDLKYNMQHLLARVIFTKNPKAAFKFLEQLITDTAAYQHTAWEYAFSFLKVSLHLGLSSSHGLLEARNHSQHITKKARNHGDKAVMAMATMMEAMVYLKEPGDSDGFEQAQRALASVRSLQLDPAITNIPQLTAFISFVDLSCHLQRFYPEPAYNSMRNMQKTLAQLVEGDKDVLDGTLSLPVSKGKMISPSTETGIVRRKPDGSMTLVFNWMPNDDIYNVGYLMSGIAMAHKNTVDRHNFERFFSQGLQDQQCKQIYSFSMPMSLLTCPIVAQEASDRTAKSIILFAKQQSWRERIAYYTRLYYAFSLASRTSYVDARDQLVQIKQLQSAWIDFPSDLSLVTRYLKGTIAQGTGDLPTTFSEFESIVNDISPSDPSWQNDHNSTNNSTNIKFITQLNRELYILSTMNLLQIIRNPGHPNHAEFDMRLAQIAPHCTQSSNRGITAAYHIINAAAPASSKIIATKQALLWGCGHAQAVNNNKLLCIILNILSWKFFQGILVDQTEKSVQACLTVAKRCEDTLWISVSAGVMADSLEAAGRLDEAAPIRAEGMRYARELPPKIQEMVAATPV